MYKLIVGNVRVTVNDDEIKREEAAILARQSIFSANQQGKLLSHIEITQSENGIDVETTERTGCRAIRKTLKQSMLDGMSLATKEKLLANTAFSQRDSWFDCDTGQDWSGEPVRQVREELLEDFEEWLKTKYSPN
ncbi:hypothetical protein LJC10_02415 [Selenomonadales bacterium OttesenSCG-928-I06]|nr:hypothetical protein [Selenomonadales bacterium OttesenSCG-928-I06]